MINAGKYTVRPMDPIGLVASRGHGLWSHGSSDGTESSCVGRPLAVSWCAVGVINFGYAGPGNISTTAPVGVCNSIFFSFSPQTLGKMNPFWSRPHIFKKIEVGEVETTNSLQSGPLKVPVINGLCLEKNHQKIPKAPRTDSEGQFIHLAGRFYAIFPYTNEDRIRKFF